MLLCDGSSATSDLQEAGESQIDFDWKQASETMDLFFQAIRLMVMFLIPAWMTMVTESKPLIGQ